MGARPTVILRPRRKRLALALAIAGAFVAAGWWISGVIGWAIVLGAGALGAYGAYQLFTRRPGLTLTETGLAWPGGSLHWNEVASFSELAYRRRLVDARFLGIESVGRVKSKPLERAFFGVDFTINLTSLDRPPDEIFDLVEAYSGLSVSRLG